MAGKFIVIDGGEGTGTTTMSSGAASQLLAEGYGALRTREPGGSPYAEKIRELILSDLGKNADAETMFGLFWAARRDHIEQTVKPALERGVTVITDRFDSSTWAYQIRAQNQPQLIDLFWKMRDHYLQGIFPDCYIILDVNPSISLSRAKRRQDTLTHFDERDLEFHTKVRDGFREFTHYVPHRVIDAGEPLDIVLGKVVQTIREIEK